MKKEYDIMVAGHVCFDVIPEFPDFKTSQIQDIIAPGKLVNVAECKMSTGGPVSNTGIGLKILGQNVVFCAKIGDDDFGKLTLAHLEEKGNAHGIKIEGKAASSYTLVLAPPNIDRIFLHHTGANNNFKASDLNPNLIAKCRHFHFGYPPLMQSMYENDGAELEKVFKCAKRSGAITSCDMSLPDPESTSGQANWRKILERILPHIDIFLPSVEETLFMLEPDRFWRMKKEHQGAELIDFLEHQDYTRLADQLLGMGTSMTSLKSGHRGFYMKTGGSGALSAFPQGTLTDLDAWRERELFCPAFKAPHIASATGSGDSSIAGFLAAFMRRLPIEMCLKYACVLGWQNVQTLDAVSGIKTWNETEAILRRKMDLNPTNLEPESWVWSDVHKLWIKQNN